MKGISRAFPHVFNLVHISPYAVIFLPSAQAVSFSSPMVVRVRQNDIDILYFLERKTNFPEWVKVMERRETGNTDVIKGMLLENVGISFLPRFVIQDYLDSGQLAVLSTPFAEIEMWSQLIYHKNKWLTPQMEAFLDLMVRRLSGS